MIVSGKSVGSSYNSYSVRTAMRQSLNASSAFAGSLAERASQSNVLNDERHSAYPAASGVNPARIYEEMTMRNAGQVQRSSRNIDGVTWNDETLALLAGLKHGVEIDTAKAINWNATGEATLTEAQITELREKYDLENLSPQDYYDFMADLSNMNVISAEDISGMHLKTAPPSGLYPSGTGFSGSKPFSKGNIFDAIKSELDSLEGLERFMYSDDFDKLNAHIRNNYLQDYIVYINNRTKQFDKLRQTLATIRG